MNWLDGDGTLFHFYKLVAVDDAGNESEPAEQDNVAGVDGETPPRTALLDNRPNPFNPATKILFALARPEPVTLRIFDVAGRQVRELLAHEPQPSGHHEAAWGGQDDDGRMVAAGIYFYRLETPSFRETKRMTLIK